MKQFMLTPAAGKRLIAKAIAAHPDIKKVLATSTLAIIAGTTNGYIAEEILVSLGSTEKFTRHNFFRGVTLPPPASRHAGKKISGESAFPGDVIIVNGQWQKGKTILDVADKLGVGDVILKGANALDPVHKRAAIFIGHPQAGTIGASLPAVVGRRARLIIPIGLEKRIYGNLDEIAAKLNSADNEGFRYLPVPGEVFTEIEAITLLTGAVAELIGGGGIGDAEGCIWLGISGTDEQIGKTTKILQTVAAEPQFEI